ncbi:MAG TPA: sulfurtransferase TusA family protein [Stellaceae bacterium]|nr:sulfurtransferase TusA family protein [Stellaceae bacterium]
MRGLDFVVALPSSARMADPTDHRLDARGLKCPLPVLKARKALREVPVGEVLTVLATDPGAPADFTHFCETTRNELVAAETVADHIRIAIRRLV